ncbi:hypothetical protein AL387_gp049 [Salmon gill poxvirus]|uniref:Uncharacterized protein n=1 Tax=Salmon gill poxvirus TaxID=1680908 RepID=A0A0H4XWF3_9POXV|nr:hypothetical protein AL387_gp049 [Salmon gill poxvirus]AKR04173.1 hypothetical protein SGPV049 [Salmon gill poxvirus]WMX26455.1 hypothetical protein [Salmon gill poxvirus]
MFTHVTEIHNVSLSKFVSVVPRLVHKTSIQTETSKYMSWISSDSTDESLALNQISDESPYKNIMCEIPTLVLEKTPVLDHVMDPHPFDPLLQWLRYAVKELCVSTYNPLTMYMLHKKMGPEMTSNVGFVKVSKVKTFEYQDAPPLNFYYNNNDTEIRTGSTLDISFVDNIDELNSLVYLSPTSRIDVKYKHPWEKSPKNRFLSTLGSTLCCLSKTKREYKLIPLTMLLVKFGLFTYIENREPNLLLNLKDMEDTEMDVDIVMKTTKSDDHSMIIEPHSSKFRYAAERIKERNFPPRSQISYFSSHVAKTDRDRLIQARTLLEADDASTTLTMISRLKNHSSENTVFINSEMYDAFSFMFDDTGEM